MVGNLSNFTRIDVLRCLLVIENPMSRSQLSKKLELGEGTIRSILGILKKDNLLASNKQGHYLSHKGNAALKKISKIINMKKISSINIFPGKRKIAVLVRKPEKFGKSHALRDEAVKNGAEGALILKYDKRLKFYDSDYDSDLSGIENIFDLGSSDMVVVAYADSYRLAEHGALAVAVSLSKNLKEFMQTLR